MYGGRTEAIVLHIATREGETIQYYDVMSLYPFVCNYSEFPIGHPKIHVGDMCRDTEAMLSKEGLIKCSVLPHKILYHSDPITNFYSLSKRAQSNATFRANAYTNRQRKVL